MRRALIATGLVWLFSFGQWCTHALGQESPKPVVQPALPELMKREVSPEGIAYLQKLKKNTPFGTNDFNLDSLRKGMGTRREPTIKNVKLIKVKVGDIPCEWVLAPGADPDVRMLYLHGGGFVSGSGGFYLAQTAHISAAAKCAVLLPDYRLAPEHKFPAGLEDCVSAHKWMVENGPTGPKPARATFIAGDSAGGSLTLATLLALRDRKLTLPTGGIAISPCADFTLASESLKTVFDPIISAKTMSVFRDHYLDKADPKNPLASPVFGDYRGLPPLLIQAGEHEMLRDDSIRVAKKARADGISVALEVWPGMFHVFHSHEPLLPEAREAIDHIADFTRSAMLVKRNIPDANQADNYLKSAKVGDWIEHKTGTVVMRHTVTARTEDSVTLRIDQTVDGKKSEPIEQKFDLKAPPPKPDPNTKMEKVDSGKETLTVDGKKYECEWVKTKTTITMGEKSMAFMSKGWVCKDLPLSGVVRIEFEAGGVTGLTELTGFGRGNNGTPRPSIWEHTVPRIRKQKVMGRLPHPPPFRP
jgi:acetyl esterase/lipase